MLRRLFPFMLAAAVIAAGCSEGDNATSQEATSTTFEATTSQVSPTTVTTVASTSTVAVEVSMAEVAPIHVIPADAVAVTGTATCTFSDAGGFTAVCQLDLTDPRVSGTEISSNYRHLTEDLEETVAVVWVADDVITNDEGAWRGVTQASDDSTPCGESHLVGEGVYEGLEFRYYFCHTDDEAQLRGWISTSD